MADISSLGTLQPLEPLDFDLYPDSKAGSPLPTKGEYLVRAPESFPSTSFGVTKAGSLSISVDPTIVAPTNEGYQLRFTKVSAKVFKRQGVNASQVGDYLRACGFRGRLSNAQEQADAVERTANQTYKVQIDWRAYNKDTGYQLEGMEKFPSDGKGGHLPWCEDPNAKDENGAAVRLRANAFVARYIPATD